MKKLSGIVGVGLVNPKFPHNVGAVVRAASCFGADLVYFTGHRVSLTPTDDYRLPREERMQGYKEVELRNVARLFDHFERDVVPVAIELRENVEMLPDFDHPPNALYIFGPEDGGLTRVDLGQCQRFVKIPTRHCLNLAAAVNLVLYDRICKMGLRPELAEQRGMIAAG